MSKGRLSVVVPCYNEQDNVKNMCQALTVVLSALNKYDYEILFIDNDSKDNTQSILRELASKDKRVKVIFNNRNFGPEQSGFYALTQTNGDAIISLACDFQEPPELIPEFVRHWEQGAKVVWGQKKSTDESKLMFLMRSIYYKLSKNISNIEQYEHVTGWGLFDREVLDKIIELQDPWPLTRNQIPKLGYKPVLIPYKQAKRQYGQSSYNLIRYFDTSLNSITHTSKIPLKMAIYIGFGCSLISFLVGIYYIVYKLLFWNNVAFGVAPLLVGVFFIASLQIFFLGILGEYVLAILSRVSFKHYVVEKERINFDEKVTSDAK